MTTNTNNSNDQAITNTISLLFALGYPECSIKPSELVDSTIDHFENEDAAESICYKWNFIMRNGNISKSFVFIDRDGAWGAYDDPADYSKALQNY